MAAVLNTSRDAVAGRGDLRSPAARAGRAADGAAAGLRPLAAAHQPHPRRAHPGRRPAPGTRSVAAMSFADMHVRYLLARARRRRRPAAARDRDPGAARGRRCWSSRSSASGSPSSGSRRAGTTWCAGSWADSASAQGGGREEGAEHPDRGPDHERDQRHPKNEAIGTSTASPTMSRAVTALDGRGLAREVVVRRGASPRANSALVPAQPEGQPVDQRAPRRLDDVVRRPRR